MEILEKLFRKHKKLVVGLMSGTSADGIDAVLVEVHRSGTKTHLRQLAFETYPYPKGFKNLLLKNSDARTARLDDITRLDILIGVFFADAVKNIIQKAGKQMSAIDLIGSHGQTIQHLPAPTKMFRKTICGTMQIGNPSVIAKLTGVVTVGDFRVGDIAIGGTGAPLVPLFDYLMLRSAKFHRALLNIGGIANITILPKNCTIKQIVAFDTGPGNMAIDSLMKRFYNKPFDKDGKVALSGKIITPLLQWLIQQPYLQLKPPKSTGREMFGEAFADKILRRASRIKREDIITTVSEFTALSVYKNYLSFIRNKYKLKELLVSGGGTHNHYIMNALKRYFAGVDVRTTDEINISSDAKEAICFAMLANETISGNPGNVPGATGAKKQTMLGAICLP